MKSFSSKRLKQVCAQLVQFRNPVKQDSDSHFAKCPWLIVPSTLFFALDNSRPFNRLFELRTKVLELPTAEQYSQCFPANPSSFLSLVNERPDSWGNISGTSGQ